MNSFKPDHTFGPLIYQNSLQNLIESSFFPRPTAIPNKESRLECFPYSSPAQLQVELLFFSFPMPLSQTRLLPLHHVQEV